MAFEPADSPSWLPWLGYEIGEERVAAADWDSA